jgi:ComF family protein
MPGIVRLARDLARGLGELLLPAFCAGCEGALGEAEQDAALCRACAARLPWLAPGPLARAPAGLDAVFASLAFEGEVEAWIRRFKYPAAGLAGLDPAPGAVVRDFARAAAAAALARSAAPDAVVPVPLHPRRLRARGFNPAALIAREVARAARAPLDLRALARVRDTPSQTGLDRSARRRNVLDAFRARSVPRRVWLADDVVTTGSTLAEAARALRRAGAREIAGVCAAATP